uniref:H0714H04.11 protein n=1 Tax=Oryza sativa TaxID=4530 RepID=Q01JU1_ORYSA|nr:H0714H04.11 [Oryza sativa]
MMGLVGSVIDASIGWLVESILRSFFTGQMEVWTCEVGLTEAVEKLKFEVMNVEMLLAAAGHAASEGIKIENKTLTQSLDDLRDLLYDADDVMDELDYYRLQEQIEKGEGFSDNIGKNPEASYESSSTPFSPYQLVCSARSQITSWASSDRKRKREEEETTDSTTLPLEIKHAISERITRIANNLQKIGNSVLKFLKLEISVLSLRSNQGQSVARNTRLTTSVLIEPKVYGRDAERDRIIELIINEGSSDLRVLPIVGIGGIGKTTLARFVYRDQRIIDHFDLQMWICVSTNFNEVRITQEILEHGILLKNIRDKRFLLILDDMWEDKDRSGWDNLLAPLKFSQAAGCVVLATTRRNSVAQMIGTVNALQIVGLGEEEFWLFFKACAFGNENYEGHSSLQSIGKQIVKALKGCPLAARSVGALLNRDLSYEHWRTVQDKWKSLQVNDDDIIPILKLSYDYLPFHLQRCFSYCSLFPEDYQFHGDTLVQAWISQSFVQREDTSKRMEETGMQYLDSLVYFGFFQKVDSHYVMHDLMHELAQQVSHKECDTIEGFHSNTIRPGIRHLSIIITGHDEYEYANIPFEKCEEILKTISPLQKLRSLMVFGSGGTYLLKFLQVVCEEAKCLRLLSVAVPSSYTSFIYNLTKTPHLRYLKIVEVHGSKDHFDFPQALTTFYHLQVLDFGIYKKIYVPTGVSNLVNLRHLIANDKVHHAIACVGNMTSLQELKFKVQNVGSFEIRQLQSMNELVTLEISHLENVKTKDEANGARLTYKKYLKELSLSWNGDSMNLEPERTKDVLEGFQPHHNLESLHIAGYSGPSSPMWLSRNLSVRSLRSLHLENCKDWLTLKSLEMLPLRKLKLVKMFNLVEVSIPSLEELILIEMPKLEKCFGAYGIELTSHLRELMIKDCPQLNEFTPFQSYSSFKAEQKSWFPSLNKLTIACSPQISKWEILPLSEMQALKELELIDQHAVRELLVPSLEKLVLIKMPSLESCTGLTASPPLQICTSQVDQKELLSCLRELIVHDCPCLVVSNPLPPSAMLSHFSIKEIPSIPTMEKTHAFTIKSGELVMLDDKILAFHNLRGIRSLRIQNCPNLVSLCNEGFNQLIDLEELNITDCPNLIMTSGLVLPSLRSLSVQTCGISGSWLTEMLSRVWSFEHLELHDSPQINFLLFSQPIEMEDTSSLGSATMPLSRDDKLFKIPSNIIPSLRYLEISDCPDLEFDGEEGALRGYTSLQHLLIQRCPKLVPLLVNGAQIPLPPPSLVELDISNLTDKDQSRLLSWLPTITSLIIRECPELTTLQLGYSKALRQLEIVDCKLLASVEGFGSLTDLLLLTVHNSPNLPQCFKLLSQQRGASTILSRLVFLNALLRTSGGTTVPSRGLLKAQAVLRVSQHRYTIRKRITE